MLRHLVTAFLKLLVPALQAIVSLITEVLLSCIMTAMLCVSSLPIRSTLFEGLVCHFNTAKLVFVTLYRPSSLSITELIFEEFISLLEIVSTYGSEIVLSGDFNIQVDDDNDVSARRLPKLLDAFKIQQRVTTSTHTRCHTLDLIITRPSL